MAYKRNSIEVPELEILLAGKKKKYVRYISLTIDDVYRFQKYLENHSVTLMADGRKLPCICID